jgi:hypothetical protein
MYCGCGIALFVVMNKAQGKDWCKLWDSASIETDPERLHALVQELNNALEARSQSRQVSQEQHENNNAMASPHERSHRDGAMQSR